MADALAVPGQEQSSLPSSASAPNEPPVGTSPQTLATPAPITVGASPVHDQDNIPPGTQPAPSPYTNAKDDISSDYTDKSSQQEFDEAFKANQAQVDGDKEDEDTTKPSKTDPHGIGLGDEITQLTNFTGKVGGDILRGSTMEAPSQAWGAVIDATKNTVGALAFVADWINKTIDPGTMKSGLTEDISKGIEAGKEGATKALDIVDSAEAQSVTGRGLRSIETFMVGFIPIVKGLKAVGAGIALADLAAGAITSATVLSPAEKNLSNLLIEVPALQNSVTEYLASNPDDSEGVARFKKAVEGLGFGVAAEGVFGALRALKSSRIAQGLQDASGATDSAQYQTKFGNKSDPWIDNATGDKIVKGTATADDLSGGVNWAKFQSVTDLDKAVKAIATAKRSVIPPANINEPVEAASSDVYSHFGRSQWTGKNYSSVDDVTSDISALQDHLANYDKTLKDPQAINDWAIKANGGNDNVFENKQALMSQRDIVQGQLDKLTAKKTSWDNTQTVNAASPTAPTSNPKPVTISSNGKVNIAPTSAPFRTATVSDKQVIAGATRLGIKPNDYLNGVIAMNGNRAVDAEHIYAINTMVEAATKNVVSYAKAAVDNPLSDAAAADYLRMSNIHTSVVMYAQGAAAEAGRALRAFQIPIGGVSKQIAAINSQLMQAGGPDAIRKIANEVAGMGDNAGGIEKAARLSTGSPLGNALQSYWYFDLLGNISTHIKNPISNALNTAWNIGARYTASGIGALRGTTEGVQIGEAHSMLYGAVDSMGDAFRAAGKAIMTGETSSPFNKFGLPSVNPMSAKAFGITGDINGTPIEQFEYVYGKTLDGLGTVFQAPTRAILGQDEFMRVINTRAEMSALAFRQAVGQEGREGSDAAARISEILQNPNPSMFDAATTAADQTISTSPLGTAGKGLQQFLNQAPIFKAIVPFVRIQTNLASWAVRNSPIGFLASSVKAELQAGGPRADIAMAKMAMGSVLSMTVMNEAFKGNITGAAPANPDLKSAWLAQHPANSIKVPGTDKWISYESFGGMGILMGLMASYGQIAGSMRPEDAGSLAGALTLATSKSIMNSTFLGDVNDVLDGMHGDPNALQRFANNTLATFVVPNMISQFAHKNAPIPGVPFGLLTDNADKNVRDTHGSAIDPIMEELQQLGNSIINRIPGWSKSLPADTDVWGRDRLMSYGLGQDLASPVASANMEADPISKYITDNKVPLAMPKRTQDFGQPMGAISLKPEEYRQYSKLAGNDAKNPMNGYGLHDALNDAIKGEGPLASQWRNGSDGPNGSRAGLIRNQVQEYRKVAGFQMYQGSQDIRQRVQLAQQARIQARQPTLGPEQ